MNFLAKYNNEASKGYIRAAKYVICYLKGTKSLGIAFSRGNRTALNSHIKFPIPPHQVTALTNANWGPQDQFHPNPDKPQELDLFKSRPMSRFLIWPGGPIHWVAKTQTITACSYIEAYIYAIDKCVKQLIQLSYILDGFQMLQRENGIHEAVSTDFVSTNHIKGRINLADLFTKEDKDVIHFQNIHDIIMGK